MSKYLQTDNVNIYTNSTLRELNERIKRLEGIEQKRKKDNVVWALNQFRYKEKTEDEQKAFCIIESILIGDVK